MGSITCHSFSMSSMPVSPTLSLSPKSNRDDDFITKTIYEIGSTIIAIYTTILEL